MPLYKKLVTILPRNLETASQAHSLETKTKSRIITGGVIAGVFIGAFILGAVLLTALPTAPPPDVYGLRVIDGATGKELPTNEITYTLYGTNDLEDWVSFEELETGTDISSILEGDLDAEYSAWAVRFKADAVDHSDTLYDEDEGARAYYERWDTLVKGTMNTLVLYETPDTVGGIAWHSENLTVISAIASVWNQENFTVLIVGNMTQVNAMYVAGSNYENEVDDMPSLIFNFSEDVALSDLSIAGTTKRRVNATAIAFDFYMISATPTIVDCIWGEDAPGTMAIDSGYVSFGDDVLFNFA